MEPKGNVGKEMVTVPQPGETKITDTCGRCGLRRATRELEERGIQIRLCDDCFWGEDAQPQDPPAQRPAV